MRTCVPHPRHPLFVDDVLRPLAARAAQGEQHIALADELYETAVHAWALTQARAAASRLPSHADAAEVFSQTVHRAWEACRRIDWERVESWPAFLERRVRTARVEAARADDWLSRRQRVYRRRFQHCVAQREQHQARPLNPAERLELARAVSPASSRVDWGRELVTAWHPTTCAEVPEVAGGPDPAVTVIEGLDHAARAAGVQWWLDLIAAEQPKLADALCRWRDASDTPSPLPARLARLVEPFTPLLLALVPAGES